MSGSETEPFEPSPLLMLSTNSIPETTLPNTVYCLSKWGADSKQIKNWLLALFGLEDLAIESVPFSCGKSLNSDFRSGKSDEPVPALFKSNFAFVELPYSNLPFAP